MRQPKKDPISLAELNQKLTTEAKRLVREKEDGIAKYVSKTANLEGNSMMVFRRKDKTEVTLAFRLNENDDLRLAYDKRFTDK